MKVLVYCPLSPITPKVYARTVTSIFKLAWQEPVDIVFGRDDMDKMPDRPAAHINMAKKYNDARRIVLECGYDALLTVEADMIVPEIALQRLSLVEADVAYGLYSNRHGRHVWLAFQHIGGMDGRYTGASYTATPELCPRAWGNVVESKGVGLGCTFIHRRVLEKIEFRLAPDQKVAPDWMFALDIDAAGFSQAHDCGVICGHIEGGANPKILWPTADGGYRIEFFDEAPPTPVQPDADGKVRLTVSKLGTRVLMQERAQ